MHRPRRCSSTLAVDSLELDIAGQESAEQFLAAKHTMLEGQQGHRLEDSQDEIGVGRNVAREAARGEIGPVSTATLVATIGGELGHQEERKKDRGKRKKSRQPRVPGFEQGDREGLQEKREKKLTWHRSRSRCGVCTGQLLRHGAFSEGTVRNIPRDGQGGLLA